MKEKMSIDKIKNIVIVILSLIIIIGGCYFIPEMKNCGSPRTEETELDVIGMTEFTTLLNADVESVIYIARPTCTFCQSQEPIVKEIVSEYKGIPVFYLNTDELSADEMHTLFKTDKALFGEDGKEFGTPTTLVVKNGKIVDSIVGLTQKNDFINFLQKNNIIK